jgi:FAD/FMN-containing dehydrogenase
MPASYMAQMARARPEVRQPFTPIQEVNILVELGTLREDEAQAGPDGAVPLTALLETTLAQMLEEGMVLDAEIAQNEAQRTEMWRRRELASEVMTSRQPTIDTDICLPTDLVASFLDRIHARLPSLDASAETISVAHLGDGNLHFTVFPSDASPEHYDRVVEAVEDEVQALGGSFSAEHGVGLSKLASMRRRKDPVALDVMRAVKAALDPDNRMNPGKVIPEAQ